MDCKYCGMAIPPVVVPSGKLSRAQVCVACRPAALGRQASAAKATKQQRASLRRCACRNCLCPLILLRLANGKEETRRVCARCREARISTDPSIDARRERVREWASQNREKLREYYRQWRAFKGTEQRQKLLIEDVKLVRDAMRSYYQGRSR